MAGKNTDDGMTSSEKPVQFKCSVCSRCFDRKWYLIVHSRIHMPQAPKSKAPRSCPKCGKVFGCTSSHFWRHKRKCTIAPENYRCLLCPNNYSTLRRLSVHMKLHTVKSSLTCTTCNISFSTLDILLEHMMIHTFTAEDPEEESELQVVLPVDSMNSAENSSAGIGKKIKKSRCGICQKIFNRRYLHDHMNVHSGVRPYKCPTCGKTFMFRSFMSTHIRKCAQRNDDIVDGHSRQDIDSAASPSVPEVIAEWTPVVADSCGSEVVSPGANDASSCSVIVKAEPEDSDTTDNETEAVNKPPDDQAGLQTLQPTVETMVGQNIYSSSPIGNSKKAKCNICDKIFNREYMSEHMNVHTGAKPHKCRTCGQSFMFRSFLATHRKKCVLQNADLPVPEIIAEWTTEVTDNYRETANESDVASPEDSPSVVIVKSEPVDSDATDTEMEADGNVPAAGPADSDLPMMQHTTESMDSQENFLSGSGTGHEKYRCGVCQMVFSRGNSLRDHMNIHSGEEPYKCLICGQGFKFRSSLAYHRKKKCVKQTSDNLDGYSRPDVGLTSSRAVPKVVTESPASDRTGNSRRMPIRPDNIGSAVVPKAEPDDSDATDCGSDTDGMQPALDQRAKTLPVITIAVYPLKLNEMTSSALKDACSRASEFGISYVKQNQKPEALCVGCAFFSFRAASSAHEVHRSLKTIRDDLTVRFIEPLENTKQIVESLRFDVV